MNRETERGRRGFGMGGRSILLVVAGVLVAIYFVGWMITGGRVSRELARLRRQGEPLRPSELLPKLRPGEQDGAGLYQEAFASGPTPAMSALIGTDQTRWTAAELAAAQAGVAVDAPYFALLDRASRVEKCVFPIDWDKPFPDVSFASDLRNALRMLRIRAEVLLRRGDGDGALAALATSYRIAAQAWQMPTLTGFRFGAGLDGIAYADLPRMLDAGRPSPAACRALYEQLGTQDPTKALVRALRGERATGLLVFEAVEAGKPLNVAPGALPPPLATRALRAYSRLGKPVWYHDKGSYLGVMATAIAAAGARWPDADAGITAEVDRLGGIGRMMLAAQLTSQLRQVIWIRDRTAAKLGLARVALALKAYQAEHGQYPRSLPALRKALPRDPFTGKPFHYRREPRGFTIWSTGVDMVDNKGTQGGPAGPRRAPKGGYVAGCDCVMRCSK